MLKDNQILADRLTRRLGVRVDCGLYRRIEDVRDPKTGKIVAQVVHDDGVQFKRADGAPIPPDVLAEERAAAEEEEAGREARKPVPVDFATALERLTDAEQDKLAQIEQRSGRFKWWMMRAMAQGTVNVASSEFAQAKAMIVQEGLFSAKRIDEIFTIERLETMEAKPSSLSPVI